MVAQSPTLVQRGATGDRLGRKPYRNRRCQHRRTTDPGDRRETKEQAPSRSGPGEPVQAERPTFTEILSNHARYSSRFCTIPGSGRPRSAPLSSNVSPEIPASGRLGTRVPGRLWPGFRAPTVAPRAGIRSPPPALRTNPDQREGSAPEAVVALNIRTALDNRLRPRDGLDSRQPGQSRRCRRPSSMSKKRAGAEPTRVAALRIRTRGRATASVARSNLFVHRGGRTSSPAFAPSSPCAHPFHRHHPWSDGRPRSALRAARGRPSPCRS